MFGAPQLARRHSPCRSPSPACSIISRTDIFQRALAAKQEFYKELATYGEDLGADGASKVRRVSFGCTPTAPPAPRVYRMAMQARTVAHAAGA